MHLCTGSEGPIIQLWTGLPKLLTQPATGKPSLVALQQVFWPFCGTKNRTLWRTWGLIVLTHICHGLLSNISLQSILFQTVRGVRIILALSHAAAGVGHKVNDLLVSMLLPEQNNGLDCGMFPGDVIHRCIQCHVTSVFACGNVVFLDMCHEVVPIGS